MWSFQIVQLRSVNPLRSSEMRIRTGTAEAFRLIDSEAFPAQMEHEAAPSQAAASKDVFGQAARAPFGVRSHCDAQVCVRVPST